MENFLDWSQVISAFMFTPSKHSVSPLPDFLPKFCSASVCSFRGVKTVTFKNN